MKSRKLSRKENQEVTREELLSAAHDCFARYGYQGSSVDRIAEKAGFSKGAFYSNFDSKASILLEILARHHAKYIAQLRDIIDRATFDELRALVTGFFGEPPSLSNLDNGNLRYTTDFRSVYATILEKWLQAPADQILGAHFDQLNILTA